MKLFDNSSDDDEETTIEIDRAFARRFKHNKKREELQRYEELKAKGLVPDDSDEDEDEDEEEEDYDDVNDGRSKKELKFFEALIKVKKQDPSLKKKEVILFPDCESDENEDGQKKEKKKKPVYLKDVVAKQLLDEGADFGEDEKEEQKYHGEDDRIKSLVYDEEQERIRREFLEAAAKEEDDDKDEGGELLKVKEKIVDETDSDVEELKKKADEYFDDEADENTKFLKEYFVNKMWIEKPGVIDAPAFKDDDLDILSEDEDMVYDQEDFEYLYQENTSHRVLGHARNVEDTVRKVEKNRTLQRKSKEQRMAAAKLEREEELRHMKNLKKKELDDRLRRIMEIAGLKSDEVVPLSARELEAEFDPDEYDRMMKKAFGDEYYGGEVGPKDNSDDDDDDDDDEAGKPNFDEEDEKLGLEKGWDGRDALAGEPEEEEQVEEEAKEDEEEEKDGKRKSAMVEKAKQEWLDEYFKLDYEDTIGDLKTRFKYGKTKKNRYGLSAMEILAIDDKELSQYVPLKKIALYKEEEYKVPDIKRYEIKLKAQEALRSQPRPQDHKSDGKKNKNKVNDEESSQKKKKKKKEDKEEEEPRKKKKIDEDKPSSSAVSGEEEEEPRKLSKTQQRRKNKAELKLSENRLKAYLKVESKSKKKAKY